MVDRVYPISEIRDAYAYVASGRKTGIVAVDLDPGAAFRGLDGAE